VSESLSRLAVGVRHDVHKRAKARCGALMSDMIMIFPRNNLNLQCKFMWTFLFQHFTAIAFNVVLCELTKSEHCSIGLPYACSWCWFRDLDLVDLLTLNGMINNSSYMDCLRAKFEPFVSFSNNTTQKSTATVCM